MKEKRWLNLTEYGKKYGISQPAVSKAVKVGRLKKRKDGKVDGNIDIRTVKSNPEDKGLLELQKEKTAVQVDLMKMKREEDKRKIEEAAVRREFEAFAEIIDRAKSELGELGLTVKQSEKFRDILNRLYEEVNARVALLQTGD